MNTNPSAVFTNIITPMLYCADVAAALNFYKAVFNAVELRRFDHEGRLHVAELLISGNLLRLHEENPNKNELSPRALKNCTTFDLGLFVPDPDGVVANAVSAGATETSPVQDYDYGYRQGSITDPFGHHWTIEKVITI